MLDRVMNRYASYAPFVLRVVTGVIFLLHGAQKLFGAFSGPGIAGTAESFAQIGITPGIFWAWAAGLIEFFGGLALLLGVFTRYAAVALGIVMLGAILAVHLANGFFLPQGFEYAFALFGACVTLLLGGAGAWALDPYLARWWEHRHMGREPHGATA